MKRKAFTLVEIIISISAIALLAGLLIPVHRMASIGKQASIAARKTVAPLGDNEFYFTNCYVPFEWVLPEFEHQNSNLTRLSIREDRSGGTGKVFGHIVAYREKWK